MPLHGSKDVEAQLDAGMAATAGECGHRLSGGAKQRRALARVSLKDLPMLALDEAPSHLDTVSERLIQAALKPPFTGPTALVIAHRLSTVLAADPIRVFDGGCIVGRGTHADLLRSDGLYARLAERQLQLLEPRAPEPVTT